MLQEIIFLISVILTSLIALKNHVFSKKYISLITIFVVIAPIIFIYSYMQGTEVELNIIGIAILYAILITLAFSEQILKKIDRNATLFSMILFIFVLYNAIVELAIIFGILLLPMAMYLLFYKEEPGKNSKLLLYILYISGTIGAGIYQSLEYFLFQNESLILAIITGNLVFFIVVEAMVIFTFLPSSSTESSEDHNKRVQKHVKIIGSRWIELQPSVLNSSLVIGIWMIIAAFYHYDIFSHISLTLAAIFILYTFFGESALSKNICTISQDKRHA